MLFKINTFAVVCSSLLFLAACSGEPQSNTVTSSAGEATAAQDGCKDFAAPLYPSARNLQCESRPGPPLRQTAYFDTADSLDAVVQYYVKEAPAKGWTVNTGDGNTAAHAVVVLKKAPGYASVVVNTVTGKTDVQVHAYPNGG